jgi:hypothetical protein
MVFRPDGLGIVWFGSDPEAAITAVQAYLGFAPTDDTGWVGNLVFGVCPGTTFRRVTFDGLQLEFADAGYFGAGGSAPQLFTYRYNGSPAGITPGPPHSIDVGITVAELTTMYPGVTLYPADEFFGPTFRVTTAVQYEQLWGQLTGLADTDTVLSITGGIGCGE